MGKEQIHIMLKLTKLLEQEAFISREEQLRAEALLKTRMPEKK